MAIPTGMVGVPKIEGSRRSVLRPSTAASMTAEARRCRRDGQWPLATPTMGLPKSSLLVTQPMYIGGWGRGATFGDVG